MGERAGRRAGDRRQGDEADVADVHSFVDQIAEKYSFTPSAVYEAAIKGFAVNSRKPEALASLRCEPKVRGISFNEQTTIAGRAL